MSASHSFFKEKRTWSKIKDELLKSYLEPYLAKVSRTHRPIIVADCFAGKGRFDTGEPGSPLIIAAAIKQQLENPETQAIKGVFIEKKYFKELQSNFTTASCFTLLEGDYEARMEHFVNNYQSRKQNLFLYVDPYGIKSIFFSHFELIRKKGFHTVELLLNLNTFGFLREACRLMKYPIQETETPADYEKEDSNTPERMNEIAGGEYWREIIDRYNTRQIRMQEAEEIFIDKYCERLKSVFKYVVNIPIKVKLNHIPKYRIVFGTNNEDALLLMVDNMNLRWVTFREEARNNQSPLFECDFPDPSRQGAYWNLQKEIASVINSEIELKELLVRLAEKFGINFSTKDYIKCLKGMENDQIEVTRTPPLTSTGKPCTNWDYNKKNQTIKISRSSQWQQPLL